mgnify:FL=1
MLQSISFSKKIIETLYRDIEKRPARYMIFMFVWIILLNLKMAPFSSGHISQKVIVLVLFLTASVLFNLESTIFIYLSIIFIALIPFAILFGELSIANSLAAMFLASMLFSFIILPAFSWFSKKVKGLQRIK